MEPFQVQTADGFFPKLLIRRVHLLVPVDETHLVN